MSKPVSYQHILEDGHVVFSRPADHSELRGPDKLVLDTDLWIKIGKRTWGVNRCVVRVCSRLVDVMMSNNMAESKSNEIPLHPSYVLADVFDQILDLLYDGRVIVRAGAIVDILAVSNFLKYAELAEACVSFLQEYLSIGLLKKAWQYSNLDFEGAAKVVGVCHQKIPGLFEEWSSMEDFCRLSFKDLSRIMDIAKLRWNNRNENVIFEAIIRWLHFDWAGRCCHIKDALAKVQWKKVNSGRAIECESVRNICQTRMRSTEEWGAKVFLLQAIGLGPNGNFKMLFGRDVATPTKLVVAGHDYLDVFLLTFDETDRGAEKVELKIPHSLQKSTLKSYRIDLFDLCWLDSRLYILARLGYGLGFVLYEYDFESEEFQYAVLHIPPGHSYDDPPSLEGDETSLFLDSATVVIASCYLGENNVQVYYIARDQFCFRPNEPINVNRVGSYELLKLDTPMPDYTLELEYSDLTFDSTARRLYFCCGSSDTCGLNCSKLVFYLDLQSKAFVRCPDYPLSVDEVATTVHDGSLFVAGGTDTPGRGGARPSARVSRLDKDGSEWHELPAMKLDSQTGELLIMDGQLYHFIDDKRQVSFETLDLMKPQDGWKVKDFPLTSDVIRLRCLRD